MNSLALSRVFRNFANRQFFYRHARLIVRRGRLVTSEGLLYAGLLLLCCGAIAVYFVRALVSPIDYDEAYNLQIVDMLSHGAGYASYGALRGDGPWRFDPNVTTGPVLLLPLALVWHITGGSVIAVRAFLALFLPLAVWALLRLMTSSTRHWSLPTVAIVAFLSVPSLPVGAVLGELPATAAIFWAAYAAARRRPVLMGLAAGLALQMKFVFAVAGLLVMGSMLAAGYLTRRPHLFRDALLAGGFFLLPTLAIETYRAWTFGTWAGYLHSLREFKAFLVSQDINTWGNWLDNRLLGEKAASLYELLSPPLWLALSAFGFLFLFCVVAKFFLPETSDSRQVRTRSWGSATGSLPFFGSALFGLMAAGIAMLVGWLTHSILPGTRQAFPFAYLFAPAFFALTAYIFWIRSEQSSSLREAFATRSIFAVCIACLAIALSARVTAAWNNNWDTNAYAQQLKLAEIIRGLKAPSLYIDGWWQNPEFLLLSAIRGRPVRTAEPQLLLVQDYQIRFTDSNWDAAAKDCKEVVYRQPDALICWLTPPKDTNRLIRVLDWGPQSTTAGTNPNRQPDGGLGLSFNIEKIDPAIVGPIEILIDGAPTGSAVFQPGGSTITASISPRFLNQPGPHSLAINEMAVSHVVPVGYFVVEAAE